MGRLVELKDVEGSSLGVLIPYTSGDFDVGKPEWSLYNPSFLEHNDGLLGYHNKLSDMLVYSSVPSWDDFSVRKSIEYL